jgi:hypothetical protein
MPPLALLWPGTNRNKHIVVQLAFLSDKGNAVLTTPSQTQSMAALGLSGSSRPRRLDQIANLPDLPLDAERSGRRDPLGDWS